MRTSRIIGTLVFVGFLAGIAGAIPRSEFTGRAKASLAPSYRNDGDTMTGFAVTASSESWTAVAAARAARRSLYVQLLDSNAYGVCLSTISAAGSVCDDSTPGIELSTGTAQRMDHTFFTENAIYARARTGSTGEKLKGYEAYDSED